MLTIKEMTCEYMAIALIKHKGNRTRAAEELGVSIRTLRNYIIEMVREDKFKWILEKYPRHYGNPDNVIDNEIKSKLFPTNEERILYMNTFPNRCGPR